jgi:hypothetical protein
MKYKYERDDASFPADAYLVKDKKHKGIAWRVLGWHLEYVRDFDIDSDCWESEPVRTGDVICVMIGDDELWKFETCDIEPLEREKYCGICGQVGCSCDGYDRSCENDNMGEG